MKTLIMTIMTISAGTVLAQDRVSRFDLNHNGLVEYAELAQQCRVSSTLFDRADSNRDGALSNSELQRARHYLLEKCKTAK